MRGQMVEQTRHLSRIADALEALVRGRGGEAPSASGNPAPDREVDSGT